MLVIGPLRLTGWPALAAQLAIGAAIGALLARRIVHPPPHGWATEFHQRWPFYTSLALWIIFTLYWSAAAKNAAPTARAESPASRQLHVIAVNAALVLLYLPVPALQGRFLPDGPLTAPIGLAIQLAGLLLAVWSRRHLGRNWSGAITAVVDHQLIRSGPYRVIRHPIYTALLGMYLGAAIVVGQFHALLALAIAIIAYWRKIRLEERNLRDIFGPTYDEYCRESWALLPPLL